jgi:DNA-binding response OmpR family regulator
MGCFPVVLIEEYEDLRGVLSDLLTFEGETVMAFGDVDSARRAIRETPALCAIVLNIEEPSSNGMTFLRDLQSHPTHAGVPIIVTSTSPSLETVMEDGVAWLLKPFDPDAFVRAVQERCRNGGTS